MLSFMYVPRDHQYSLFQVYAVTSNVDQVIAKHALQTSLFSLSARLTTIITAPSIRPTIITECRFRIHLLTWKKNFPSV
jgi:hypothetical protein